MPDLDDPLGLKKYLKPAPSRRGVTQFQPESDWSLPKLQEVETEYQRATGRPLPVRVRGQGAIHNRLGYQHQDSADISVRPGTPEAEALEPILRSRNIPFLAFDRAIPGVSTGPHYHIGRPSKRGSGSRETPTKPDEDPLGLNKYLAPETVAEPQAPIAQDRPAKQIAEIKPAKPFIPPGPFARATPERRAIIERAVTTTNASGVPALAPELETDVIRTNVVAPRPDARRGRPSVVDPNAPIALGHAIPLRITKADTPESIELRALEQVFRSKGLAPERASSLARWYQNERIKLGEPFDLGQVQPGGENVAVRFDSPRLVKLANQQIAAQKAEQNYKPTTKGIVNEVTDLAEYYTPDFIDQQAKKAIARLTGYEVTSDRVAQARNSLQRGINDFAIGALQSIPLLAASIDGSDIPADKMPLYVMLESVRAKSNELFPNNPKLQEEYIATKIPQGIGSSMALLAIGAATGGLGAVAGGAGIGTVGALGQMAGMYQEAKASGATEAQAREAMWWGIPIGASEVIGVGSAARRLNALTSGKLAGITAEGLKGALQRAGLTVLKETGEEAFQNTGQGIASAAVAKHIYDSNRDIFGTVKEDLIVGVVSAFLMSGAASAPNVLMNIGQRSPEPRTQQTDQTETPISSPLPSDLERAEKPVSSPVVNKESGLPAKPAVITRPVELPPEAPPARSKDEVPEVVKEAERLLLERESVRSEFDRIKKAEKGKEGISGAQATEVKGIEAKPTVLSEGEGAVKPVPEPVLPPSQPTDFVPAPEGGIDYGEITSEVAQQIGRPSAPIRLHVGDEHSGQRHIQRADNTARLKKIQKEGYASERELITDVARNHSQIWESRAGGDNLMLVKPNGEAQLAVVELVPSSKGDYYSVLTAGIFNKNYPKGGGRSLLWERGAPPPPGTGFSTPPPSTPPGFTPSPEVFGVRGKAVDPQGGSPSLQGPVSGHPKDETSFRAAGAPSDAHSADSKLSIPISKEVVKGQPAGREVIQRPAVTKVAAPEPVGIARVHASELNLDPERFQYKIQRNRQGGTGSLTGVKQWNPNLEGVVSVWRDPADGKTYVVNGHNRYEKANELGVPEITVRYLDAKDAKEARALGAKINIAEGQGTATDAAQYFRDTGESESTLREAGIPLERGMVRDALALSDLDDFIFSAVKRGDLTQDQGVAIGTKISSPDLQAQAFKAITKATERGKPLTKGVVDEMLDAIGAAPRQTQLEQSLFGDFETERSLFNERAQVAAAVKRQLAGDKSLFGTAARKSGRLAEGGTMVDVEQAKALQESAAEVLGVFDTLKNRTGGVSGILDAAAKKVAAGQRPDAAARETYGAIKQAVNEAIRGSAPTAVERGVEPRQRAKGEAGERTMVEPKGTSEPLLRRRPQTSQLGFTQQGLVPPSQAAHRVESPIVRQSPRGSVGGYFPRESTSHRPPIAQPAPQTAQTPPPNQPLPNQPSPSFTDAHLLAEVDRILDDPKAKSYLGRIQTYARKLPREFQRMITSEFTPLRLSEEQLIGKQRLDLAAKAELLPGASGQAELDLLRFQTLVVAPIAKLAPDFNRYLLGRRIIDRLSHDPNRKKVAQWTVPKAEQALAALKKKVGDVNWQRLEKAAVAFQQETDAALQLRVDAGLISQEVYDAIKGSSDFYAPFKVMKYVTEQMTGGGKGTGRRIPHTEDLIDRIKGIEDADFQLQDFLLTAAQQIYQTRILAEKNRFMRDDIAPLADSDAEGEIIRQARPTHYYRIEYKPAEEILAQLSYQKQPLEQSFVKAGRAIELAEAAGLRVRRKNLSWALGRATIGGMETGGQINLKAFTSEVISHELGHTADVAQRDSQGNRIYKSRNVFGTRRDILQRLSSDINTSRTFQKEMKALVAFTGLGGDAKYQSSAKERFAEFVELYIHNPKKARELAPTWTDHFELNILPNPQMKQLVEGLAKFFQKVDALPNILTPLKQMEGSNYLELAIRRAFPDRKPQIGVVFGEKARPGYKMVEYLDAGTVKALEVRDDFAKALEGLHRGEATMVSRAALLVAQPFKWGATTFNLAFQPVNLFLADLPRAALISKYGVRRPGDLVRFPADWLYSLFTSMAGNFGFRSDLYEEFMKSGAYNSTIQRELTPEAFKPVVGVEKSALPKRIVHGAAKVASALEETSKLLGIRRGKRFENFDSLSKAEQVEKMREIASEVRRFSGSPDFWRKGIISTGQTLENMNLLFMFLNARIQGTAADLARLSGRAGGGRLATAAWLRLSLAVGIPALTLMLHNLDDDEIELDGPEGPWKTTNRESYKQVPDWERENYFMIPRGRYFLNDRGERVRDYWKIPKREIVKLFGNMIEAGVQFADEKNPEHVRKFAVTLLENLSPVNISGKTSMERAESGVGSLNPILKTPAELIFNRDTFRHRKIVPDYIDKVPSKDLPPEEQYTRATSRAFIRLGKVLGVSPLLLEHGTRGFTAGLVTQFMPPRPQPGRSPVLSYPAIGSIARRFVRSESMAKESDSEILDEALKNQATERVMRNRQAYQLYQSWKKNPEGKQIDAFLNERGVSPEIEKQVLSMKKDDDKNLTRNERQIKQLGVENGDRASYLKTLLNGKDASTQELMIEAWREKGIASKEVIKQLELSNGVTLKAGKRREVIRRRPDRPETPYRYSTP